MLEKILTQDQSRIRLVPALPSNQVDGRLAILTNSAVNPTYAWLFQFVALKPSNKWVFLGGSSLFAEVTTAESTTSSTYTDLATVGPSITLPVAGDYEINIGARMFHSTGGSTMHVSYSIGATGATDADAMVFWASGAAGGGSYTRKRIKTGLGAVTLTLKYKTNAATATFSERWISATPIAVAG